jgi:hypothetical protein
LDRWKFCGFVRPSCGERIFSFNLVHDSIYSWSMAGRYTGCPCRNNVGGRSGIRSVSDLKDNPRIKHDLANRDNSNAVMARRMALSCQMVTP